MAEVERERVDRVEIRLLGNLRMRRADGAVVDLATLRTRKTMDLLRLLALRVGEPVAVPVLLERLWPEVPESRGRASLRTAASTIRSALGSDSVERRLGGLALSGPWVDTVAFSTLASEARILVREGRHAEAVMTSREAEALYLHDFRADDDGAAWVVHERDRLRATYGRLMEDAAEAALALGWYGDVDDFASRAIARDPFAERAVRALMSSHAATGQVERALRVFQRCRRALVDELGVEPSPQTSALHLRILRGEISAPATHSAALTGREAELTELVELIRRDTGERPSVVELRGPRGSGHRRLVEEARRVARAQQGGPVAPGAPADQGVVHVRTAADFLRGVAEGLVSHLGDVPATTVVLVASSDDPPTRRAVEHLGWAWHAIELGPLDVSDSARLMANVLGGPADEALVREVFDTTGGRPGSIVGTVRQMMQSGRMVSTSEGITLVLEPGARGGRIDAAAMVARALEVVTSGWHDVLYVLAVAEVPLDLPDVVGLLPRTDATAIASALDQLVDVSILSWTAEGYRFRHPLAAAAVRAWLRPSVRRNLRARIASRLPAASLPAQQVASSAGDATEDPAQAAHSLARTRSAAQPPLQVREVAEQLGIEASTPPDVAEVALQAALAATSAAANPDGGDRAAAVSLLLAERVLLPRRRLAALDDVLDALPALTPRGDLLGEAEVLRWLPPVLLGRAATALLSLEAAVGASQTPAAQRARLRHLVALARQDLGYALSPEAGTAAAPGADQVRLLPVALFAQQLDPRPVGAQDGRSGTPLARQLHALVTADRHDAAGRPGASLRVLRAAADDAAESGCTLMLPEIAARLVILGAGSDGAQARADFDLMEEALGVDAPHPRELFFRLLARSHVRLVHGDRDGAASTAESAARVATAHGLTPLAGRAADVLAALRTPSAGRADADAVPAPGVPARASPSGRAPSPELSDDPSSHARPADGAEVP